MTDLQSFMEQACDIAKKSTCLKRQVGAIIVKENKIISKGWNGGDKQYKNCLGTDGNSACFWKEKAYYYSIEKGIPLDQPEFKTIKQQFRRLCLSICAERCAIYNVLGKIDLSGSIIFSTTYPCPVCAKEIRMVGIVMVYFLYDFDLSVPICEETYRIFQEAGIKQEQLMPTEKMKGIGKRTDYEYEVNRNR